MFLGINVFWALLRAHFNPRLTAAAKMSLSQAQNIFMPANINSIVLLAPAYPLEQIPDFLTALFKDNSDHLFSKPFVVNTRR